MYTLYKTIGTGAPQIIGFYDDPGEGVAAMEEDRAKNDEVDVGYCLKSDKEGTKDDAL